MESGVEMIKILEILKDCNAIIKFDNDIGNKSIAEIRKQTIFDFGNELKEYVSECLDEQHDTELLSVRIDNLIQEIEKVKNDNNKS